MKRLFSIFVLLTLFLGAKAITVVDAETNFSTKEDGNVDIPVWGGGDRLSYKNGMLHFHSEEKTKNEWDVQFFPIASATLKADVTYTVEFKIKGTGGPIFNMKLGKVDKYGVYTVPNDDNWHVVKVQYIPADPKDNNGGVLFQCGEYVGDWDMEYMKITHEEADGQQKVLVITSTADKDNPWDSQVFINLPSMTAGKQYFVRFLAKSTADFKLGTESIDDKQTEHKDQYDNSAIFNYTTECDITTEYKEFTVDFPGKTNEWVAECYTHDNQKHENFEYAATALLLNIGRLPKDAVLTIAKITLYDETMEKLSDVTIAGVGADNKSMSVYYPNWQNSRTVTTDYQDVDAETSVKAVRSVTEDGPWYTVGGVKVASPSSGIYIHNGSKVCKKQ